MTQSTMVGTKLRDRVAVRLANDVLRVIASAEYRALLDEFYRRGITDYYSEKPVREVEARR